MTRPSTVSPADLARWQRRFEAIRAELPPALVRLPRFREQFLSGEWLGEQLLARQIAPEAASDICFAHGQKCAHRDDPWTVAAEILAAVEAGEPPVPGPSLSADLLKEAGLSNSVDGLIEFLLDQGYTPDEMDRTVDKFRQSPRYPPEDRPGHHAHLFTALQGKKLPNLIIERMLLLYRRRWQERHGG